MQPLRYRREPDQRTSKLVHPNIVRAYDAGEEAGVRFLVMEYVDGVDVARIKRAAGLGVAAACEIIRQAAIESTSSPQRMGLEK